MNIINKVIDRIRYGCKLAENLYRIGGTRDTIDLLYKGKKIVIYKEHLAGNPSLIIYAGYSKKEIDKQEKGSITDDEFRTIIELLEKSIKRTCHSIYVKWEVPEVEPPTEETLLKLFPHWKNKSYTTEKLADGSLKVSFPPEPVINRVLKSVFLIIGVFLIMFVIAFIQALIFARR